MNEIETLVSALEQKIKVNSQNDKSDLKQTGVEKTEVKQTPVKETQVKKETARFKVSDYPLIEKHKDNIKSPTGKPFNSITLENVRLGNVTENDLRISKDTLYAQGEIASSASKEMLSHNFQRAAELTVIPDDKLIAMYDLLRPNRATKQQLLELADTLENKYNAKINAKLVLDALYIYEKRGILLK